MGSTVIVAGARTPMGRLSSVLAGVDAVALGGAAIAGALERSQVPAADVQYVIMGQVLPAGCGQLPARQAAVAGGVGMGVPALTINKVCLSGLAAIAMADQLIRAGVCDVVVAGGMESMSRAPHLLPGSRAGHRYGNVTLLDHMEFDGLRDVFTAQAMGALTEQQNDAEPVTRQEQDAFAARSHQRAAAAVGHRLFTDEIVPVTVPGRKGSVVVEVDEGIRPETTAETLAALRPAFRPDGTITAGSASPISDGAAAVVVMRKELAESRGLAWLAEIEGYGMVAGPDSALQLQPANAIRAACETTGIDVERLDLIEINEAFAAVVIASARDLKVPDDRVNVNGGAIALGHPIGASGARIVLHLALELARRGGGMGAAALCGGGGQGDALIISAPSRQATRSEPAASRRD